MVGFTRVFRLSLNPKLDPGTVVQKLGEAIFKIYPFADETGAWIVRAKSLVSSREEDASMLFSVDMNISNFDLLLDLQTDLSE